MEPAIPVHPFTNNIPEGYLVNVEKVEFSNPYEKVRLHRHAYYELFVFDDMRGIHFVDFENIAIVPKSIHLVLPHQVHRLERSSGSGYVMMFKKEVLMESKATHKLLLEPPFINTSKEAFTANLDSQEFDSIWRLCTILGKEFLIGDHSNKEVIQTLLEAMLLKIKGCIKITEATETQSSILLRKFLLLLDQHFQKNYTVYEYAKMLHVTTLKLNSACNKILRKTASQLICDKVILESKRLLVSTDWSAKEIAFHLNFNDPAYFNRFFKKHTCLNPGMFRNTTGVNSAIESK